MAVAATRSPRREIAADGDAHRYRWPSRYLVESLSEPSTSESAEDQAKNGPVTSPPFSGPTLLRSVRVIDGRSSFARGSRRLAPQARANATQVDNSGNSEWSERSWSFVKRIGWKSSSRRRRPGSRRSCSLPTSPRRRMRVLLTPRTPRMDQVVPEEGRGDGSAQLSAGHA